MGTGSMEDDIDRLRRREAELEAEIARLKAEIASGIHSPDSGQKTSAAGPELLFTAAEKTRMPQIITDPNQPDNPIVFANRAFQDLCGYSAEELVGHNCRFLQGPGTDPADVARLRDAIAARRDVVVEIINYHRDGTPFRNELYVSPVFDRDGRLRYFFGSQLDVTRFRTEEGKLAESESRYRTLFDAIDAGFCIVEMRFDATGRAIDYRFIEVNPAFERQAGLGDVEGRWVSEVIPGIEPRWLETYGEVALSGNPVRFESGAVTLGRWFDVHALRIGEPVQRRVAILFNDITDRREAETVLRTTARERTTERDLVWRASRDLLVICGFDGIYRSVNPAWSEMLGWPADSLVGARFDAFVHPDDRKAAEQAMDRLGMRRLPVELLGGGDLHDPAEIEHHHPVGDHLDHRQVVADEHHRQAEVALQPLQQVDHLRLYGHVEGGDRLVGDDELRTRRQRPGDRHALPLAAGEGARIALHLLGGEADLLHQPLGRGDRLAALLAEVQPDRLQQRLADRHAGVEAGERILEDHLHVAAEAAQLAGGQRGEVGAVEGDAAAGGRDQAQDQPSEGGLARARFAHHPENLAGPDVEVDALDRADCGPGRTEQGAGAAEVLGNAPDVHQRGGIGRRGRGEGGDAHSAISFHRRQRTSCSGAAAASSGSISAQRASAKPQRS